MTIKTLLTTAALTIATATSGFAACFDHEEVSMTCANGSVYDADTNTCKVVSG
ncbi:chitin-binding domain-containing protein [Marivita sp.]|jgi:hypothetical protein|uniref:chitin-binding domain-containing protein n=1 Tax=Marivita sp. TaxID=2003365 RepID=UPI003219E545